MSIDAENPTPDRFAAMALEAIERAVEGFRRRDAGLQETISTLAADNGRLRGRVGELEKGFIEATVAARAARHLSGADPIPALDAGQKERLWAALSCQIEFLNSCRRHAFLLPGPSPGPQHINQMSGIRDILFPAGKPESDGGEG